MIAIWVYWTPYRGIETALSSGTASQNVGYWTPYRGIDTIFEVTEIFHLTKLLNPL